MDAQYVRQDDEIAAENGRDSIKIKRLAYIRAIRDRNFFRAAFIRNFFEILTALFSIIWFTFWGIDLIFSQESGYAYIPYLKVFTSILGYVVTYMKLNCLALELKLRSKSHQLLRNKNHQ